MSKKLFVGGLSWGTTDDGLHQAFERFGEIVEANTAVVANPALVNSGPYTDGWFYKIKLSNPAELDALLTPEQYQAQIGAA